MLATTTHLYRISWEIKLSSGCSNWRRRTQKMLLKPPRIRKNNRVF